MRESDRSKVIVGKGLASIIGVMGLANLTPLAPIAWIASGIYAIWALSPGSAPGSRQERAQPEDRPAQDASDVEISLSEEQLEEMGIDPSQESINMTEAELRDFLDQVRTVRKSAD
ncbi:MAG: hypothetical protein ABIG11_07905 [bacterium]